MKKYVVVLFLSSLFSLFAQGAKEATAVEKSVVITSLNGAKQEISLEVPYDPQRIAILDMAALDILSSLGVCDRVVGSASTSLSYLKPYAEAEGVALLGTIKEASLEAVMAADPDIIFIGGRLASSYDALSKIAPVVFLSTDTEKGVVQSTYDNAKTIASIFGKENEVDALFSSFDNRIAKIKEKAAGKKAIVGLVTSGSFNVLGSDGRCSLISRELGFANLAAVATTSTHGNEISFEYLLSVDPDYIFVLDRDAAIATKGAKLAKEIVENELVKSTKVYKEGHIVYLSSPAVWYTAEGGVTALDIMLSDIERIL